MKSTPLGARRMKFAPSAAMNSGIHAGHQGGMSGLPINLWITKDWCRLLKQAPSLLEGKISMNTQSTFRNKKYFTKRLSADALSAIPSQIRRRSVVSAMLSLVIAGTFVSSPALAAWGFWARYPYPAHNPALTPSRNCQDYYLTNGTRAFDPTLSPQSTYNGYRSGLISYYRLHEPYHSQSISSNNGAYNSEGDWIGNPPVPSRPRDYGACLTWRPADRNPLQADQDFSGEVVDFQWEPWMVFPLGGGTPVPTYPPPLPKPPTTTKEEFNASTVDAGTVNGRKQYWIRASRNVDQIDGNKVNQMIQSGWILLREKAK